MTLSRNSDIILIHPDDNTAVALKEIPAGVFWDPPDVACRRIIPAGHKVAVRPIAAGEAIIRYGHYIGRADIDINPGDHVHTHNMSMGEVGTRLTARPETGEVMAVLDGEPTVFQGFVRPDGRVGTRNYIGLISSVNCSAGV